MLKNKIIRYYVIVFISITVIYLLLGQVIDTEIDYLIFAQVGFFVLYFSTIYFIKKIKAQDNKTRILRELPFFLNNLASDIEKNMPLKLALENRAKQDSAIGKKIKKAMDLVVKKGYNLESALEESTKDNKELQKVIYQINDILSSGTTNKAETFRILSNNFSEQQSIAIKNYSTKLNFISLIFVVVSAIVPALFLMFFLVGSNFFEISISKIGVIMITVVFFPIIDMFILMFMRSNLV
ncbi:MAG TPA: type II secretion system F family protein [Candidatus Diapherotrites archaeon]|jgi:flagellar protein FlaJ|nr:type II secretion system F family protein [Candidatus Diapherotrites archaeon]